jgi:uncharacterized protein YebE (UPF0316 family)
MQQQLLTAVSLTVLAAFSVSLWTVRVAFTADRRLVAAAGVAAMEATMFAVAFSTLLGRIDSPVSVLAYALGVAAGTMAALRVEPLLSRRPRPSPADPSPVEVQP